MEIEYPVLIKNGTESSLRHSKTIDIDVDSPCDKFVTISKRNSIKSQKIEVQKIQEF